MNGTCLFLAVLAVPVFAQQRPRAADIGLKVGTLPPGALDAITDVAGVRVGHTTLNVPRVADALIDYMLALPGNDPVRSINPLVAETNDGYLNDIRGRHVGRAEVFQAIRNARN
jgi:D-aminopeptidase